MGSLKQAFRKQKARKTGEGEGKTTFCSNPDTTIHNSMAHRETVYGNSEGDHDYDSWE